MTTQDELRQVKILLDIERKHVDVLEKKDRLVRAYLKAQSDESTPDAVLRLLQGLQTTQRIINENIQLIDEIKAVLDAKGIKP